MAPGTSPQINPTTGRFDLIRNQSQLNDLTDVTITTPADNDVLAYDTASLKWINQVGGGGGSGLVDKTYLLIAGHVLQNGGVSLTLGL